MKIWLLKVAFCIMYLYWCQSVLLVNRRDNTADIILEENNLWVFPGNALYNIVPT